MLYFMAITAVVFVVLFMMARRWHYCLQILTLAGVLGAWMFFDGEVEQSVVAVVGGGVLCFSYILMLLDMGRKYA
jgi:hypothetical protein